MKQFTLSTGSYLGVEVPENVVEVAYRTVEEGNYRFLDIYRERPFADELRFIPEGQYSLIGENPLQLTDEEAAEIVEDAHSGYDPYYKDYSVKHEKWLNTALESYQSLLTSLGLKEPVVILRKLKK